MVGTAEAVRVTVGAADGFSVGGVVGAVVGAGVGTADGCAVAVAAGDGGMVDIISGAAAAAVGIGVGGLGRRVLRAVGCGTGISIAV
jgi:hypothetical protein